MSHNPWLDNKYETVMVHPAVWPNLCPWMQPAVVLKVARIVL